MRTSEREEDRIDEREVLVRLLGRDLPRRAVRREVPQHRHALDRPHRLVGDQFLALREVCKSDCSGSARLMFRDIGRGEQLPEGSLDGRVGFQNGYGRCTRGLGREFIPHNSRNSTSIRGLDLGLGLRQHSIPLDLERTSLPWSAAGE